MPEVTINVRDDIPDALRDALIAQLEAGRAPLVAGNLADLNRLGAKAIADHGPDETFRLNPNQDEDAARRGAERAVRETEAVADAAAHAGDVPEAGPDEDPADKDPRELARTGEVEGGNRTTRGTTTTADTATTADTVDTSGRRSRRGGGE